MPELKQNFIKGRMNLDLDERLVPDGEYRRAMNIEVSTSEGSNVGAVQSVRGNILATNSLTPSGGEVVGSITNEKSNKIYYFIRCNKFNGIAKDMIVEYSESGGAIPVFVDVYEVDFNLNFPIATFSQFTGSGSSFISAPTNINIYENIREGMLLDGTLSNVGIIPNQDLIMTTNSGQIIDNNGNLIDDFGGPFVVDSVNTNSAGTQYEIYARPSNYAHYTFTGGVAGDVITFKSKRILNFTQERHITGINIIDNLLFWTDNISEPKKINIQVSKNGTPSFNIHTKYVVYKDGVIGSAIQYKEFAKERDATVIKQNPLTPPNLEMYRDINARGVVFGVTDFINFSESVLDNPNAVTQGSSPIYEIEPFVTGTTVEIPFANSIPDFEIGDILLLTDESSILTIPQVFTDGKIRVVVTNKDTNALTLTVKILSFKKDFFPYSVDANGDPDQNWAICLEQSKSLFEFKFPRFAYRYKYQDGEYSSFSPFSEIAFLAGSFKYSAKEAHNLGMINQIRFIKILDFVPDGIPPGVIEIDILYKESNSPNVYTVKTIKEGDPEWLEYGHTTSQAPWTGQTKGAIQLESEVIYATVPSNQALRPWDNVPRLAKAQEISANRVIYGNYVEGYNMQWNNNTPNVNIQTYVKSKDLSNDLTKEVAHLMGEPSIKSLRTYQVGIIYKDDFGRETPVFTNEKASFNIAKSLANDYNSLSVQSKNPPPSWADSYKFFIKETSNEYYNLALDRWYDAQDGHIWLSFPSAERNKVDEDTYLILKKRHDVDTFVEEPARYKVIAIENEAPDWIKTERVSLGIVQINAGQTFVSADGSINYDGGDGTLNDTTREKQGMVVRIFDANATTDWFRVKNVNTSDTTVNTIKLKTSFGVDVTATTFGGAASVSPGTKAEVAQEKVHNKPEFQGRFFVKIKQDSTLLTNIDTGKSDLGSQFTVLQEQKQYYIKSSGVDNAYCREKQWQGSNSWTDVIGFGFYIDEIERNWGNSPKKGPYPQDDGYGITNNRAGFKKSHLELSISGINDWAKEGFSMALHDSEQINFYNAMKTETSWIRWKEDPNGIVYEIRRGIAQEDAAYGHGSGIYNWSGNGSKRKFRSNKTKRIYIDLKATGWMKNAGGSYVFESNIKDFNPTWIDDNIETNSGTYWVNNNWDPTKNNNYSGSPSATNHVSIEQPTTYGNDPGYSNPNNPPTQMLSSHPNGTTYNDTKVQNNNKFYNHIQIVQKYNTEADKPMSESPAVFETEPKEDIGLDIYHEMDQAFPIRLNNNNNELFVPIGSEVRIDHPDGLLQTWKDLAPATPWTIDISDGDNKVIISANVSNFVSPGDTIQNSSNLIPTVFPAGTFIESISDDGLELTMSEVADGSYTNQPITITKVTLPKVKMWNDNRITLDCKIIGSGYNSGSASPPGFSYDNIFIPWSLAHNPSLGLNSPNGIIFDKIGGGTITASIFTNDINYFTGIFPNNNGFLEIILHRNVWNSKIDLNWFNCYSFGNGVESNRIRDDFNAVIMDKGPRVSTTLAKRYRETRKANSLIYSGIYNSSSGVNNTSEFIAAEKITKDLNPRHGSIQKLHAREQDLIALCEDKILRILSNKDALYNADGNPQLVATDKVLGQATPMGGEYGISKNPESFASQAYKAYFTDRSRGVVLKMDSNGVVPISDHGMKDYFADELRNTTRAIGSYDDKKDSYNLTLIKPDNETISFGERTNGWTSFKSFIQQGGTSLNNNYYTFSNGNIFRHHEPGPTATFYGARRDPFVDVLLNQQPDSVKSFGSLNYEGSQARIDINSTDPEYYNNEARFGWFVSSGETNLQTSDRLLFKDKEGKWFSRMKGLSTNLGNIDLKEFSFQGIDMASSMIEGVNIPGCTDPTALNFDPNATSDCSNVVGGNDTECCCYEYGCTDNQVGYFPFNPDPITGIGLDRFQNPCGTPCIDANSQPIGFAADNFDYKFDCCSPDDPTGENLTNCCNYPAILFGCTDPTAYNYYAGAVIDDGTCIYCGCTDPLALNYDVSALCDDGSCTYCTATTTVNLDVNAQPGSGFHPNIQGGTLGGGSMGATATTPGPWISNSNHIQIFDTTIQQNNIVIGCSVSSQYLPTGTEIINMSPNSVNPAIIDVFLSNLFNMAPTFLPSPGGVGQTINIDVTCGACDTFNIITQDLGDQDQGTGLWQVSYSSGSGSGNTPADTDYQNIIPGTTIPPVSYMVLNPVGANNIQASDFCIGNSTLTNTIPRTFTGGSLPPEVAFVVFEDSSNSVYTDWSNPNSPTNPNPNYNPNLTVGSLSNTVNVIVALNPVPMPNSDLVLELDIDFC